ncbi:MAG: AbrB/MazE/SpoVT family DNA-binding domain-containing protein [Candidatus Kariarchaeaceae archaeon]
MKVSKKGQIVIPANYRDRLGIEGGMEVMFRIRGHYLLVELDTDVDTDLKYLRDKKNKLVEEDIANDQTIREIVYDLLSQQFYHGNDLLTDRVGRREYKIRGSDSIIQQVVEMLVHAGRHWQQGNYIDTLKEFADDLELDFPSLLSKLVNKFRSMEVGGDDMIRMMGGEVIFSMAIGEALMQFRTRIGDETRERLLKEANVLGYVSKLGNQLVEDVVIGGLSDEFSILLNLKVLRELARMSVKSVGERKFNVISGELLSEFEQLEIPDDELRRRERRRKRAKKKVPAGEDIVNTEEVEDEAQKPFSSDIIPFPDPETSDDAFDLPEIPDID